MMPGMARVPEGPPPPPVVQRLRLQYAKRGRLRFSSHRDFQRALERALRRAGVPMAYSAGFNPHPKISYANAAPTGAASEAEYVELGLARRCEPEAVRAALDQALPPGLDIVAMVEAGPGALAERLQASRWQIRLPGVPTALLRVAVDALMAAASVPVQRQTKTGQRTVDARSALVRAEVLVDPAAAGNGSADPAEGQSQASRASSPPAECAILDLVVRHTTPAVRPDDVLAALRVVADLAPPSPPVATRLAQGPLDEADGAVADPLAADQATSASDA